MTMSFLTETCFRSAHKRLPSSIDRVLCLLINLNSFRICPLWLTKTFLADRSIRVILDRSCSHKYFVNAEVNFSVLLQTFCDFQ